MLFADSQIPIVVTIVVLDVDGMDRVWYYINTILRNNLYRGAHEDNIGFAC